MELKIKRKVKLTDNYKIEVEYNLYGNSYFFTKKIENENKTYSVSTFNEIKQLNDYYDEDNYFFRTDYGVFYFDCYSELIKFEEEMILQFKNLLNKIVSWKKTEFEILQTEKEFILISE